MIRNEYNYNTNFKKYVDEFCKNNNCTVEDALENDQVKRMFWRYTEV
ncbi:hypothetical protein [Romboutsia ilealis]|nr:hypothetical protein [Romboutsia ilealis]